MRYVQRIKRLKLNQPLTPHQQQTLERLKKRFNDVTAITHVPARYNQIVNHG